MNLEKPQPKWQRLTRKIFSYNQKKNLSARIVIAKNFPRCAKWDDNSFAGLLHEECVWSHERYWELESALYVISDQEKAKIDYLMVFCIYSRIMINFSANFDENDLFKIKNLSRTEIYALRERVELVFEGFFKEKMPKQDIFEMNNPLLS